MKLKQVIILLLTSLFAMNASAFGGDEEYADLRTELNIEAKDIDLIETAKDWARALGELVSAKAAEYNGYLEHFVFEDRAIVVGHVSSSDGFSDISSELSNFSSPLKVTKYIVVDENQYSVEEARQDANIVREARTQMYKLGMNEDVNAQYIHPYAYRGKLILFFDEDRAGNKEKAIDLVKNVKGVKSVVLVSA